VCDGTKARILLPVFNRRTGVEGRRTTHTDLSIGPGNSTQGWRPPRNERRFSKLASIRNGTTTQLLYPHSHPSTVPTVCISSRKPSRLTFVVAKTHFRLFLINPADIRL
jgi:hypothetical protein